MRVSPNFTLSEFAVSEYATRKGITFEVPPQFVTHVEELCETVLEPLRAALGRPIVVLSGYRPSWLNTAVGGSRTSDHLEARAADIVVPGVRPIDVCTKADDLELPYKQVIHEFGRWTHISIPPFNLKPIRQALTAFKSNGKTVYRNGLHEVTP